MDEKSLKTSFKQRLVIIAVAVLLLGSTMLTYLFVVLNSNGSSSSSSNQEAKIAELTEKFDAKNAELEAAAKPLSDKYFSEFVKYKSKVKAYNEVTATNSVLATEDLKVGTGKTLEEGDDKYIAYYIGWCADGSIFDSSFDNQGKESTQAEPTALKAPIEPANLIEGWKQGVIGMKLNGVRIITMNGDLAYGESREICGGTNKPLKFIVMPIAEDENLKKLNSELSEIYIQLYMAYYGA